MQDKMIDPSLWPADIAAFKKPADEGGQGFTVCKECAAGGNQSCCGLFGSPPEDRLRKLMREYADPNLSISIHKKERDARKAIVGAEKMEQVAVASAIM